MIDRTGRQLIVSGLTNLLNGSITTDDFTCISPAINASDRGIVMIWTYVYSLYDDSCSRQLLHVTPETRNTIERCLLFLKSDLEYRWPDECMVATYEKANRFLVLGCLILVIIIIMAALNGVMIAILLFLLLNIPCFIVSFIVRRCGDRQRESVMLMGDSEVWPFLLVGEYQSRKEKGKEKGTA